MAEFLTTSGTSYIIEKIIIEAQNKLVLVSPYLQLSKTLYERLKDTSKRKVSITVIYGKDELKPNERNSIAELENLRLYYFENLHAKCYFNESSMVITSMNMYAFSEKNNREMGVQIDRNIDSDLYLKAVNEIASIKHSSEFIPLNKSDRNIFHNAKESTNKKKTESKVRGYCIRCEERIPFNPNKPFCGNCFIIWAQFENNEYPENVCHCCGEYESINMEYPQCYSCFKSNQ